MQVSNWVLIPLILMSLATHGAAHADTVVVSGGAAVVQKATGEERKLSALRTDCASYNRTSVGFVCGFDDGQKTVLQFDERDNAAVKLFDAEGKEIEGVRRVGSYIVLPQLYRMVFVRLGKKEAVLMRTADKFVETKPTTGVAPVAVKAVEEKVVSVESNTDTNAASKPVKLVALIKKGERIDLGLQALAMSEGWEFLWYPAKSWKAINDIDLSHYKDAAAAVADVIDGLRHEGKPVRWQISDGNKVIEIFSTEVKND